MSPVSRREPFRFPSELPRRGTSGKMRGEAAVVEPCRKGAREIWNHFQSLLCLRWTNQAVLQLRCHSRVPICHSELELIWLPGSLSSFFSA